jgi:hypothetical protein
MTKESWRNFDDLDSKCKEAQRMGVFYSCLWKKQWKEGMKGRLQECSETPSGSL